MKIVIESTNFCTRWPCYFCDGHTSKTSLLAVAKPESGDNKGERVGDVCEECLKAGPDGMKRRVLEKATAAERYAKDMRTLAERLQGEPIDAPTHEEFVAAKAMQ